MSLTHAAGLVVAPHIFYVEGEEIPAPTKKPSNSMPCVTSESDRLAKLLDRKIARRLRQQKEIHKIDKELGDLMKLFRSNAGITLAAMAYKTNLPFKHLYDLEQGARSANLLDLVTIFGQYDIPIMNQIVEAKRVRP